METKKKKIPVANISQNWKKIQKKILSKEEKAVARKKKEPDTRPLAQQIFDPRQAAYGGYNTFNKHQ